MTLSIDPYMKVRVLAKDYCCSLTVEEDSVVVDWERDEGHELFDPFYFLPHRSIETKVFNVLAQKIIDQYHEIYRLKKELEKCQWENQ